MLGEKGFVQQFRRYGLSDIFVKTIRRAPPISEYSVPRPNASFFDRVLRNDLTAGGKRLALLYIPVTSGGDAEFQSAKRITVCEYKILIFIFDRISVEYNRSSAEYRRHFDYIKVFWVAR